MSKLIDYLIILNASIIVYVYNKISTHGHSRGYLNHQHTRWLSYHLMMTSVEGSQEFNRNLIPLVAL